MDCHIRPDLCDDLRHRLARPTGLSPAPNASAGVWPSGWPMEGNQTSNSTGGLEPTWTPPKSRIFDGAGGTSDPTAAIISGALGSLFIAFVFFFVGK